MASSPEKFSAGRLGLDLQFTMLLAAVLFLFASSVKVVSGAGKKETY